MVEKINASIVLGLAKPAVATLVGELNEKIKYYQTTLTMRNSRGKSEVTKTEKA